MASSPTAPAAADTTIISPGFGLPGNNIMKLPICSKPVYAVNPEIPNGPRYESKINSDYAP